MGVRSRWISSWCLGMRSRRFSKTLADPNRHRFFARQRKVDAPSHHQTYVGGVRPRACPYRFGRSLRASHTGAEEDQGSPTVDIPEMRCGSLLWARLSRLDREPGFGARGSLIWVERAPDRSLPIPGLRARLCT